MYNQLPSGGSWHIVGTSGLPLAPSVVLKKVNFEGIIYERLEAVCLLSELTENSGLVIKINNGIQSNFPSQRSGRLNCNQSLQVNSQGIYQVKGLAPPCAEKCQTLICPMFIQVLSARSPVAFLDNLKFAHPLTYPQAAKSWLISILSLKHCELFDQFLNRIYLPCIWKKNQNCLPLVSFPLLNPITNPLPGGKHQLNSCESYNRLWCVRKYIYMCKYINTCKRVYNLPQMITYYLHFILLFSVLYFFTVNVGHQSIAMYFKSLHFLLPQQHSIV